MIKLKLRGLLLTVVLALLASVASACGTGTADPGESGAEVVTVQRGTLVSSITAIGSVRARAEAGLSFEVSGRVSEVLVQAGENAGRGQPLARLDAADLELNVRSADAALVAAQAELDQLRAGPRAEQISAAQGQVAAAQAALDQVTAQRDQLLAGATEVELTAARAAVKAARANYERVKAGPTAEERALAQAALDSAKATLHQAQASYDRVKERADAGMLPEALAMQDATIEMNRAQANYNALLNHPTASELASAAAQVAEAEAQLARIEAGTDPQLRVAEAATSAAKAQRDIAQAQLDLLLAGATAAELTVAKARVEQAKVAADGARLALERTVLQAPFEGMIARVDIEVGEFVSPQAPAMTLVGGSQFEIEADVDEADIGWTQVGQDVRITFDAFQGQSIAGRVVSIAPLASVDVGIVSYRVTIESEPTSLPLRGGMTANAEIVRDQREDVLLVPNLAISIDADNGRRYVEKKTLDGTEQVEITTGLTTERYSEVTSGLQEGDQVVIFSLSAREQFREMMGSSFTGGGSK